MNEAGDILKYAAEKDFGACPTHFGRGYNEEYSRDSDHPVAAGTPKFYDDDKHMKDMFRRSAEYWTANVGSYLGIKDGVSVPLSIKANYIFNQKILNKLYPSGKIKLYRSVNGDFFRIRKINPPLAEGEEMDVLQNSLSSWTSNREAADFFGGYCMEAEINTKDIMSCYLGEEDPSNNLVRDEREFVVIGKKKPTKIKWSIRKLAGVYALSKTTLEDGVEGYEEYLNMVKSHIPSIGAILDITEEEAGWLKQKNKL